MLRLIKTVAILLFVSGSLLLAQPNILINEVVSSNSDSYRDENYNNPDWIELYNNSLQPVNLKNWRVSDRNDFYKAWVLPDTILNPKQLLLIHASGENRSSEGKLTLEATGLGIVPYHQDDSFTFHYIKLTGDFDIRMRVYSMRDTKFNGKIGLIMRENLHPKSPYAGFFALIQERNSFCFLVRKEPNTYPDRFYTYTYLEYPDAWLRLVRKDDSVMCYTWENDYEWKFEYGAYYPAPEQMYAGIALSSVNQEQFGRFAIGNLWLDGYPFDFSRMTKADIDVKIPGRSYMSQELHTDFKIAREGETIYLWKPDGEIADTFQVPYMPADYSCGRYPESNENIFFFYPTTPEKRNINPYESISPKPFFSTISRRTKEPFDLEIFVEDNTFNILYTLNGAEPDASSNIYTGRPIRIDKTSVIRARAYKQGSLMSETVTASFIFDENYGISTISIVTDSLLLWEDNKGIFAPGREFMKVEIPVHFDLFDSTGNFEYSSNAGMKLHGTASRMHIPQKSFRLYARNKYDDSDFFHSFFKDNYYSAYSKILLRNAGQDWSYAFLRDALASHFAKSLTDLGPGAYRPAMSYINGRLFGLYNIRERIDEQFIATKYNIPVESIVLLENHGRAITGSAKPYWDLYNLILELDETDSSFYDYLDKNIALDNLADYIILRLWSGIQDWPDYNQKYWKSDAYDGKWRWLIYDSDLTLGLPNPPEEYSFAILRDKDTKFAILLDKILQSSKFRTYFLNRAADLLNTFFQPDSMLDVVESFAKNIETAVSVQNQNWEESAVDWSNQIDIIKKHINERFSYQRNHFLSHFSLPGLCELDIKIDPPGAGFVRLNTLNLYENTDSLFYFSSVPVHIRANAAPGYIFEKWSDNRFQNLPDISVQLPDKSSLTAYFKPSSVSDYHIVINEIMYRNSESAKCGDWIELYNNSDSDVDISGWQLKDNRDDHVFIFQNNTYLKARDYIVVAEKKNDFRNIYPNVTKLTGDLGYGLGTVDQIRLFDKSGRKLDSVSYYNYSPWPLGADGTGYTIELINPDYDNTKPENWAVSKISLGTPAKPNSNKDETGLPMPKPAVFSISPNPVRSAGLVTVSLDNVSEIELKIYDLLGNERMTIYKGYSWESGIAHFPFFNELPSGAYIIKLKTNKMIVGKPVIFLN